MFGSRFLDQQLVLIKPAEAEPTIVSSGSIKLNIKADVIPGTGGHLSEAVTPMTSLSLSSQSEDNEDDDAGDNAERCDANDDRGCICKVCIVNGAHKLILT